MTTRSKKWGGQPVGFVPNNIEHGWVGGDIDAPILGYELFSDFGPAGFVGQVFLKRGQALLAQSDAVYQKKDALHMGRSHERIDQSNSGACLLFCFHDRSARCFTRFAEG